MFNEIWNENVVNVFIARNIFVETVGHISDDTFLYSLLFCFSENMAAPNVEVKYTKVSTLLLNLWTQ